MAVRYAGSPAIHSDRLTLALVNSTSQIRGTRQDAQRRGGVLGRLVRPAQVLEVADDVGEVPD
jgi:hypothetical protein